MQNKIKIPQNLFIGGKGGVGKSTISSSIALMLSEAGKKTLLISTDPAHNLSDIFGVKYHIQEKEIRKNLFLLEIDSQKEVESYIHEVSKSTKKFISPKSYDMLDTYYKNVSHSAEAKESALFNKLINIICNNDQFSHIIIDTAPTGHTIRLFTLSSVLKEWNKTLLSNKERNSRLESIVGNIDDKDSITQKLEKRYLLYTQFNNILKDKEASGISFVLNPDSLSLNETQRAIQSLVSNNINPIAFMINKIPPDSDDKFFKDRYNNAMHALNKIQNSLKNYPIATIPLLSSDVLNIDSLRLITEGLKEFF